ncbi:hypothetical protein MAPG_05167 [Magnaporthiopsis poae ATCC 64411]|uniref:Prp 4 CRoW domain-containing protein n=1 Tax=Magnaporthiopsis poae (strain ATCC 64411 / 73-15) TaxID=644358 RepID=A0A0C4DYP1_MAGP6|nr:hypothetical protein MAPG_05167 [Magnaporthiopsis poae ATCC 64411]
MLFKSVAAAAAFAVASHAANDVAVPVHMAVRQLFGAIHARDETGYSPDKAFCAMGTSCAEACGAGYEMCPSSDSSIHCFNQAAKAHCCPGNAGVSCDDGFYCANDAKGEQLCCPVGKPLSECEGAVVSVAPLPPVTSTASSSSSSSTSTSTSTTSSTSSFQLLAVNTTTTAESSFSTHVANTTASAGFTAICNSTTAAPTVPATRTPISFTGTTAMSTPTQAVASAAIAVGPSAFLLGLSAVAFAALL